MRIKTCSKVFGAVFLLAASMPNVAAQNRRQSTQIAVQTLITIMKAEDERRWDRDLQDLFSNSNPQIRKRAALAAGRIGDDRAIAPLSQLLSSDSDNDVRQMAAFAIGEIESPAGIDPLLEAIKRTSPPQTSNNSSQVYARALEALGKIAAALPNAEKEPKQVCGLAIVKALGAEAERAHPDRLAVLLGLTATLRARPDGAGPVISRFLQSQDPRIVADALNVIARLRLKEGVEGARPLLSNRDPIVRANAARVALLDENQQTFDRVLELALHDSDLRVRVSAIRTLGGLKQKRAVEPLVHRSNSLTAASGSFPLAQNELLEIATTLGRLLPNTSDPGAIDFLKKMHELTKGEAVEVETAFARIAPALYLNESYREKASQSQEWQQLARRAQGLAAIRDVITGAATGGAGDSLLRQAQAELAAMLGRAQTPQFAVPDILQSYSNFNPPDIIDTALPLLHSEDVIIRATAAEVIGNQKPDEKNARALIVALENELRRPGAELNDAVLALITALGKQKRGDANEAVKSALDSRDQLVRRRAVAILKANGVGDFSNHIGTVQTSNSIGDYRRAIARIGQRTTATVETAKGAFVIEFLAEDAPLNVDNFIQLSRRGYFNGQRFPRVVPNFVIQAGDPRGDGNGGPGYQIRCEINEVPYDRAAVGMALSGKDTGGSQWFVTHSPQPHLDGGYTVFAKVIAGMSVVDSIARGDLIRRITINARGTSRARHSK